ncbi:nuclease [Glycocaulis albus]|uniref:Nuclease n=1 Tax=Glycocaulis albus TaxID=1382801 RepID=A0ABQ1XKV2_9PROT|nr:thermonuclease family protein [Glycocaulis albus]GGG96540.1 nuclease [Glycocaulis albus]
MGWWRSGAAGLALALAAACGETTPPAGSEPDMPGAIAGGAQALSADRLVVWTEGRREEVRLAGIAAPRAEPSASLAREALQALLDQAGEDLRLEPAGPGRNRHGTLIAEASGPQGSLQDALISLGWVMTDSHGDHTGPTPSRLVLEEAARNAGLGAWAHHDLRVHGTDPNALAPWLDSVQIVEGRVISTGQARDGRIYLNFGTDWRTDFTVQVMRRDQRRFEAQGVELRALEGAVVRVRGWLFEENGPMISLDHPEALEMVNAPEPARLPGR